MKSIGPFYTLEPGNRKWYKIDALHEPCNIPMKPINGRKRILIVDMIAIENYLLNEI